jgi:GntR family transcriptional regulator
LSLISRGFGRSTPLPTEPELAKRFRVSRMTVRQAYGRLVTDGVVVRYPGVGSFVEQHVFEEMPLTGKIVDFLNRVPAARTATRRVVSFELSVAPPDIGEKFGVQPGKKLTLLQRARIVDGVRSFDTRWMPPAVHKKVSAGELERGNLMEVLPAKGFPIASMRVEIDAHLANEDEARELRIDPRAPVLERRIIFYGQEGKVVVIGTSIYPAEHFTYSFLIELKRAETS